MNTTWNDLTNQEKDIFTLLYTKHYKNQRTLAKESGYSLGTVNKAVRRLHTLGLVQENLILTSFAKESVQDATPKRAVIFAAGFGMRMVPINMEQPKAFLEIHGECLIERQIRHLQEAGIKEIYIVVGFMKEEFEYLMDTYGVYLIVNPKYAITNTVYSLYLASAYLENAYIVPSDIWCRHNPFHTHEFHSWYMVSDQEDKESDVRINRSRELVRTKGKVGNAMIGICYLTKTDAAAVCSKLKKICGKSSEHYLQFWEETLFDKDHMLVGAKEVSAEEVVEINTYEQLREIDENSSQLHSDALLIAAGSLGVNPNELEQISALKKGMTNRSFIFTCRDSKYIMRIPGEGTDHLINRQEEYDVYQAIDGKGLCDSPIYINAKNGYKITRFLDQVRTCDVNSEEDLKKCMHLLKQFHDMHLHTNHTFDLFKQIDFYENLRTPHPSLYKDYKETKDHVLSLKDYVESHVEEIVLTHIDAVPDNFLFYDDNGKEGLQLTDWEYSGMQDPHVDIAMFCIYSLYNRQQIDHLIDLYFENHCPKEVRIKIYCYIAICGLLWSNWCEYKRTLGIEFGEYSLRQYRYAKEYYRIAVKEIKGRTYD